jgi:hypothetical protein
VEILWTWREFSVLMKLLVKKETPQHVVIPNIEIDDPAGITLQGIK